MPPLALANLNFLGREHPSFQNLLATKRLLGKGCLCLKQLFLGQGESAEVEKGLQGNTVMISQPQMTPEQILPSLTNLLDSLVCDPLQFWGRSQGLQRLARVTPRVSAVSALS